MEVKMNVRHGKISFILFVTLFMFVFGITAANGASAPAIGWAKSYGGSGTDWPRDIQQTRDGGYIVVGSSDSNNGDVTGNHGKNDFCGHAKRKESQNGSESSDKKEPS